MCLYNRSLIQEYILVIKATYDKANLIIDFERYITKHIVSKEIECDKFTLIDTTEDKVIAIGDIKNKYEINENNQQLEYKYELSNIIDLRLNSLNLDEVFLSSDLDKIKSAEENIYISSLNNKMLV